MHNETKKTALPNLRFPEFRDAGEWEEKRVGSVLTFQTGFPFDSAGFNDEGNGIRLIKNRDLKADDRITFYSKPFDERFIINNGNVLVGMDGDFTPCVWNKGKALLNQRVGRILAKTPNNRNFLYHFLTIHLKAVEEVTARTTVKHLSHSDIEKLHAPIPEPDEQQKIAATLSSLDDLITAQSAQLANLQAHKRGLMQALFPAEGETVPKLRFPEFQGVGEWEEKTLGEISTITSGATPNRSKPNYWNGNIPWITTSLVDFNIINFANEYITETGLQNSSAKLFPKGTILMAMYGQGKTRGQVAILGIEAATNQACAAILLNKGFDTNFVYQNLAARYQEIRESSNQGGQENLSGALIKSIPFAYPGIEEQQKIADCLTSLDNRIAAQTEKIEALKLHKKGLMQHLFPAAAEATA